MYLTVIQLNLPYTLLVIWVLDLLFVTRNMRVKINKHDFAYFLIFSPNLSEKLKSENKKILKLE